MTKPNAWAKHALEAERKKRGYYCQNLACAFLNWETEFAHLRPTLIRGRWRGMKERTFDIRQHPQAYALLCKDCHYQFDKQGMEITLTVREEVA